MHIMGRRWMWAQPFFVGGFAAMFLLGAVLALYVALTDPSAPVWGRALVVGFAAAWLFLAAFIVLASAVVAGPEGVSSYRVWRERRWLSWEEIESFGTDRSWSRLGVVFSGGEVRWLASVASFDGDGVGILDTLILLVAIVLFRPKGSTKTSERSVRRLAGRIAEVRYRQTGDAGSKEIVVVKDGPPRPSRQVSISGRSTHDEIMATDDSKTPYLLPSERANAQAASRRRSRGGKRRRRPR